MNTKHTPGPWEIGEDYGDCTPMVTYQARDVCRVTVGHGDEIANVRLIAAAPDLADQLAFSAMQLEAADEAFGEIADNAGLPGHVREMARTRMVNARDQARAARAALAKAEGRPTAV